MSQRDLDLIQRGELAVTKVAQLLGRTRQAVYDGIRKKDDYLQSAHILAILQELKRSDYPRVDELLDFIETRYADHNETVDKNLVSPSRVGLQQLQKASLGSRSASFVCNENERHLTTDSLFVQALSMAIERQPRTTIFVAPSLRIVQLLDSLNITVSSRIHQQSIVDIPTAIFDYGDRRRAFGFTRISIEEFLEGDADSVWTLARGTYSKIAESGRPSV